MAVIVANPDKIISGNVQLYYGDPDISEPLLDTDFLEGSDSTIVGLIMSAVLTRQYGHILFLSSLIAGAALDSANADLTATNADDGAANDITLVGITWNPGAFTNLSLTFTVTTTSTNDGATNEVATDGAFVGKSMYFQRGGVTAEIPMTGSANGLQYTTDTTTIGYQIPNTYSWAQQRSVLDSLKDGDTYDFRIATSGGVQAVTGSNDGWSLLADELYGEDGISISLAQTVELQRLLRDQLPVRGYRTAEEFSLTFPNLDFTVDTLAFLMNQRGVTNVAASADRVGSKTGEMERGVDVSYNSLLVQFNSPDYLGGKAQFYLPRTLVTSNIDFSLTKVGTMAPVTFGILRSSTHDSALRYTAQTAVRTS